jgi:Leucine-rich repeat (LRR) protein
MDEPLDSDDEDDSDFDLDFDAGVASQLLFNQEYAELNPTSARGKVAPASDADAPWPDPDAEDLTLSAHAAEELPDLKPLKRLRELTLQIGECRFDLDRGDYVVDCGPPVDLARLLPSATLERLLCQNTDLRRLDALSECPNLRRLTFHQCRLELGNGPIALPRLEEFEAPGSTLADLSPVAKSPQLRLLWIPGTRVCDLGPVAGFAHVETVSICDTAVADLGPLATLPSLRTLEVTKGQFAAAALKAFRAARPDVTIEQRPPDAPALILGDGDAH